MELVRQFWPLGILGVTLLIASVTDVRSGKIPNWVTYPAVVAGLIGHTLVGGWRGDPEAAGLILGLQGSLLGLAAGFGPLLVAWWAGGIGGGDAKLMGAVGVLGGATFAFSAMFFGFAVAAIMAVIVMLRRRLVRRTLTRIGRFLYLVVLRGKPGDPASADSPTIAFGFALCVGSAAALCELLIRGRVLFDT